MEEHVKINYDLQIKHLINDICNIRKRFNSASFALLPNDCHELFHQKWEKIDHSISIFLKDNDCLCSDNKFKQLCLFDNTIKNIRVCASEINNLIA